MVSLSPPRPHAALLAATRHAAVGALFLPITRLPFTEPEHDDDIELMAVKEGLTALMPFGAPKPRDLPPIPKRHSP
jgi:hypothetical protein